MSAVRFGYTVIYVPDVQAAMDFYVAAFGFEQRFITPEGNYGELMTGETTLAFAAESLGEAHFEHGFLRHSMANPPFGTELAFVTDDVDAAIQAAVNAGAQMLVPTQVTSWGQTVAWLRDPIGVLIEICTPITD